VSILTDINDEDFERQISGGVVKEGNHYYFVTGRDEDGVILRDHNNERLIVEEVDEVSPDLSGFVQSPFCAVLLSQVRVRQFHRTASLNKYSKTYIRYDLLEYLPQGFLERSLGKHLLPEDTQILQYLNSKYNDFPTAVSNILKGKSISEAIDSRVAVGASNSHPWLFFGGLTIGHVKDEGVAYIRPEAAHYKEYLEINCNFPVEVVDAG